MAHSVEENVVNGIAVHVAERIECLERVESELQIILRSMLRVFEGINAEDFEA